MEQEKLVEFLKEYADILTKDADLSPFAPFRLGVKMASGQIHLEDNAGHVVGCFFDSSVGEYCPSMPIGPLATTIARVTVTVLNALFEKKPE